MTDKKRLLSIVVPCYNEDEVIKSFHDRLSSVMSPMSEIVDYEIVYVNDGSSDKTAQIISDFNDEHVNLVTFSRNFGKEAGTTAGIDYASGDAVVIIDADLQDPPELIKDMVSIWNEGYDVVYAKRDNRAGETWLKKKTASCFYNVMDKMGPVKMPRNVGDFRLMDRKVVEALKLLPERHRFMKGLFAWVGFKSAPIVYNRDPRFAGETKWNYWKLWNFALEGITGYTLTPVKMASYVGVFFIMVAMLFGLGCCISYFNGNHIGLLPVILFSVLLLGGIQIMSIGILGEYAGRTFDEAKQRPLYIVDKSRSIIKKMDSV